MSYPIGFRPSSENRTFTQMQIAPFFNQPSLQLGNPQTVQRLGSSNGFSGKGWFNNQFPNLRQSVVSTPNTSILSALKTLYTYSSALGERRTQDRSNGVGLFAGAHLAVQDSEEIARQMEAAETLQAYEKLMQVAYANRQYARPNASALPAPIEKLGSEAQGLLYKEMLGETQKELGELLGFDPKKLIDEMVPQEMRQILGRGAASSSAAGVIAGEGAEAAAGAAGKVGAQASGTLSKAAGFAGAAYSAYSLVKDWGNMPPLAGAVNGFTAGAYIGSMFGAPGSLIGGAIGALAGAVNGLFGGHKSKPQLARDSVREMLQKSGIINSAWGLTLADGSTYDIGKDGGAKLMNLDGTERHVYDLDLKDPRVGQAIGWVQPLVNLLTGGNPKLACDFTGYFVNAALSNANDWETVRANIQSFYVKAGVPPQDLCNALAQMSQQGAIDSGSLAAYVNGVQSLFDPNYQPTEFAGMELGQAEQSQSASILAPVTGSL